MKVVILIIASNDKEHEKDLLCQQKTWISNCHKDVKVIFLRGWNEEFYFEDKDVLYVPCREDYSLILTKTILGMKYIHENYKFDVLIRSNVSTYFETYRLVKELNRTRYKNSFFGGYFDQTTEKDSNMKRSYEYISGAGMFFSKDVVGDLIRLDPQEYTGIGDDLAISNYLFALGRNSLRIKRNNLQTTHIFIPTFYIRTKNSFDSNSSSRRLLLIHDYFVSTNWFNQFLFYFKIVANEFREFTNHPEGILIYLAKNRITFLSYLKTKITNTGMHK
jgi:hypothetical protein